jgi:hypothetical protein
MNLEQPTRRINVERFNLVTRTSFQHVLAALDGAIGHPNMGEVLAIQSLILAIFAMEGSSSKQVVLSQAEISWSEENPE